MIWPAEGVEILEGEEIKEYLRAFGAKFRNYMRIEEAMVYLLSTEGRGMSAETLAWEINSRRLHVRKDGAPVSVSQIWALFFKYPEMFVRDGKLIRLMV